MKKLYHNNPTREVIGYGVTANRGSLDRALYRHSVVQYDSFSVLKERLGGDQFYRIGERSYLTVAERDIHNVFHYLPKPTDLDLVYSDHTYFHLLMPWMALSSTCNHLKSDGGIAFFNKFSAGWDTANSFVFHQDGDRMSHQEVVQRIKECNPGHEFFDSTVMKSYQSPQIAVQRRTLEPFRTNLFFGKVFWSNGGESIASVYLEGDGEEFPDFVSLDTFKLPSQG